MWDKKLQIRADDDFLAKVEYLRHINGYKSNSETVRKVAEKEYMKERLPIMDAVEVVRCKDCRYWSDGFCSLRMDSVRQKDFCSYGEREGGDTGNGVS